MESNKTHLFAITAGIIIALAASACVSIPPTPTAQATDYAQAVHWLSIPVVSHDVDVFYLNPTAWQKVHDSDPNICDIDNPSMLAGSASAFERSATAFEPFANIYPRITGKRTRSMP